MSIKTLFLKDSGMKFIVLNHITIQNHLKMAEKLNIFAHFEHAYNFGLKFCSYFKNNVLSDSFL